MATMYFYCCSNSVLNNWDQKNLCMLPSTSISASQRITKPNWNPTTAWRRRLRNSITFKNSRITNSHKKKTKKTESCSKTRLSCKFSGISGQNFSGANLRFHHVRLSSLSVSSLQHLRDSNLCLRRFSSRQLLLTCGTFL